MIPTITLQQYLASTAPAELREEAGGRGVIIQRIERAHASPAEGVPLSRPTYFSVVVIRTGRGTYTCNSNDYELQDRTIYLATPGHPKSFQSPVVNTGYVLCFTPSFALQVLGTRTFLDYPTLAQGCVAPVRVDDDTFAVVANRCEGMLTTQRMRSWHQPIRRMRELGAWVNLILSAIDRELRTSYPIPDDQLTPLFLLAIDHILGEVIAGTSRTRPTVQSLAAHMHLTADTLSRRIKQETGRTAQDWLSGRLADQLVTQLRFTSDTIGSIALHTGFSDASNMARFVLRHTGRTPRDWRQD